MTEYKLSRPVEWGEKVVESINLEKPTVALVREIGRVPYVFNEKMQPEVDMKTVATYIARCSKLPPSVIDKLDIYDFQMLAFAMFSFFITPDSEK